MSRWPSGITAAYLQYESEQRLQRVLDLHERRYQPTRSVRITFDGREYISTPSGMARTDGGDPGDEQ
jgi:hypothetical protein